MADYTKSHKLCCTCSCWGGPRKLTNNGRWVNVKSITDKGKCQMPRTSTTNMNMGAANTCKKWDKWGPLT
ncbi:hypothetical protein DPPLL_28170 [Desulfofustis limnaeus]|uniref:Uncharacterized protein n=1 Tax=Desulfofustis limnaeus TaxID=2740163 RepID=A0ABM7WC12_9BACT|nr:hypothetical protein DPPLL_28170 [Desulfofustis limnaeus]